MFSGNKIYDVLILPRGCQADDLQMSWTSTHCWHIYFFHRRSGCALFRLSIKLSAIRSYVHTCACPGKAAQMYFGSMKYTTRIPVYTYSLIKPAFPFLRTTCTRLTFSRKVGCNGWLNFNISLVVDEFFFSKIIASHVDISRRDNNKVY